MRKFTIPLTESKKAMPRALYLGEEVRVTGIESIDSAQRCYYFVKPVSSRNAETRAVRCDKLIAL
jgi:hypothetical protein